MFIFFYPLVLTAAQSFPYGFKRDDRSTWDAHHLPYSVTGGLYNRYAVNHEDFVWKIRTYVPSRNPVALKETLRIGRGLTLLSTHLIATGREPGILKVFSQIWGTDDLIASFDGMNASLPINSKTGRTDIQPTAPWPHMDQNPRRNQTFELYQGIANLSESGPEDGGLCVLAGSHVLHQQFFDATGGFKKEQDAGANQNGYNFTQEDINWYKKRGCKEVKICCGEGDLIRKSVALSFADRLSKNLDASAWTYHDSVGLSDHPLECFASGRKDKVRAQ